MSELDKAMVETLQKREDELWEEIKKVVDEATIPIISELIEVNIELESYCNQ